MNIGILGTGRMATGLGNRWAKAGHTIVFGSRDLDKGREAIAYIGGDTSVGSYQEVVDASEVIMITVPWPAVRETLTHLERLRGKILLEITNVFEDDPAGSTTEQIIGWAGGARVVKAFNAVFSQILHVPQEDMLVRPDVFMIGEDADAKAVIGQLITEAGFDPFDAGGVENARHLQNLALFIIEMGYSQKRGMGIGFKIVQVIP